MKLSEIRSLMERLGPDAATFREEEMRRVLAQLDMDPGDLYQELEMESRLVDTHRDTSREQDKVNLHSHSFYELLYCRSCSGVEYLVGSDRYRLQNGDIILIAPGISHCPLYPERMEEPYIRDVVWISTLFLEELGGLFPEFLWEGTEYTSLLRVTGIRQETIRELFRNGVREAESRAPGWEMSVAGNTVLLLGQIYRAFRERTAAPLPVEKPDLLERVMAHMEQNLSRKLTLGDVARQFYVSESTVTQLFRKKMGVSFHRCLTQRRLIAAKSLIEGGAALEDVGRQVGFADYSSFYRAFRQEYGICPRQYRKRYGGEENPASGRGPA